MIRTLILAAGLGVVWTPLVSEPANAQGFNNGRGPPAVAGRNTMMRAGPQAGYPQVRRIDQGQQVQLYGCLDDRSWCDVGYGNDRGWIMGPDLYGEYQGRRDSIANLYGNFRMGSLAFNIGDYWDDHYRQQSFYGDRSNWEQQYFDRYQSSWGPRPNARRWANRTATGVILRRSLIQAGPSASFPRLGMLAPRSQIVIHGCLRNWSWCDISFRTYRGWVIGQNIAATYRGRTQRLSTVAPMMGIGVLSFTISNYWNDHYRTRPFYQQRDQWERHYDRNYQPGWGPRQNANQRFDREQRDQRQDWRNRRDDRRGLPQPEARSMTSDERLQAQAEARQDAQRDPMERRRRDADRNDDPRNPRPWADGT